MQLGCRAMLNRRDDLIRFYELLERLEQKTEGPMLLADCNSRMSWPSRGVYFFMELGEVRTDTGAESRIVRVGTHGLKLGSKATLWQRLSQHKGQDKSGGGNHRGSIFRRLVGTTLIDASLACATWGRGSTAIAEVRSQEMLLEKYASSIIRSMPFLCLAIDDAPAPESLRGLVEKNSIALLSNFEKASLDAPTPNWRGYRCDRVKVRRSGLWNQNHVDEAYDPLFLDTLEKLIDEMKAPV